MKSISKPQYRRFVGLAWWAISLMVVGCGGQGADNDDSLGNQPLSVERNVGPIPANGYCGSVSLGADGSGRAFAEGEYYAVAQMNENLAKDADLRAFTGLERVSTCEDARAYSAGQRAYRPARLDQGGLSNSWPADLAIGDPDEEALKRKIEEDEVPKILQGATATKVETVQILYFMDEKARENDAKVYKKWGSCTAVRIAGPLFLTAAHCINPYFVADHIPFEPMYKLNTFEIRYKSSPPMQPAKIKSMPGACNDAGDCEIMSATAYLHPRYTGPGGEIGTDMAVIYVDPQWQLSQEFRESWNKYSFLGSQVPITGQLLNVYGWGPSSNTDRDMWNYEERAVPGLTIPISTAVNSSSGSRLTDEAGGKVDLLFRYGNFGVTTTATKQFCRGDSGSPAYRDSVVRGILSGVVGYMAETTLCPGANRNTFFERVDLALDFIPRAVRVLQSGAGAAQAGMCRCVFHGFAVEDPSAYVDCADGCLIP